jgi:hypothetical protein
MTFSFTSNSAGGGVSPTFYNSTDTTFYDISVTTMDPGGDLDTFFCDNYTPYYFSACSITRASGMITVLFYNCSDCEDPLGIPPGYEFKFTMNTAYDSWDPNGSGGWVPNTAFGGTANVPEAGTLTLLVTGLGMLAAKRKLRRHPSS